MPAKPATAMVAVDVNPVRVTTTLLKLATLVGVKVTVTAAGVVPATAVANVTPNEIKLGVTAASVPVAVVSSTVLPAKVAAAIVVDAACATEGRMMFVRVNDAAVPAVSVPAVNVTVNTLDVKVAVAAAVPAMPAKPATAMVAVEQRLLPDGHDELIEMGPSVVCACDVSLLYMAT